LLYLWWKTAVHLQLDTADGTLLVIWMLCANYCAPFTNCILLYSCSSHTLMPTEKTWKGKYFLQLMCCYICDEKRQYICNWIQLTVRSWLFECSVPTAVLPSLIAFCSTAVQVIPLCLPKRPEKGNTSYNLCVAISVMKNGSTFATGYSWRYALGYLNALCQLLCSLH